MTYGSRGKIGLLIPSLNTTMEFDFNRLAPPGLSVHVSRVRSETEGTIRALEEMGAAAVESAALLAACRPDVAVFGCTSASFVKGPGWTAELEHRLTVATGCPVITTSTAMERSLNGIGARRVSVLTPYVQATNDRMVAYLESAGITVVDLRGLSILDMYAHAEIESERLFGEALMLDVTDADAVFIACTQLKAIDIIARLEHKLERPVVTAVQASLYSALQELNGVGLPIMGYGSLLERASYGRPLGSP